MQLTSRITVTVGVDNPRMLTLTLTSPDLTDAQAAIQFDRLINDTFGKQCSFAMVQVDVLDINTNRIIQSEVI